MFHLFTDEYDDVDGNGYYDVKDFLNMKNEDILKENGNKRFSVSIQNPPYDKSMHLKFLEKLISAKLVMKRMRSDTL